MRKLRTLAIAGALALVLAGCSDDDHDCWTDDDCTPFVFQILSDQQVDGDIGFNPLLPPGSQYTIKQANITKSLLFGIDPDDGTEFRAFLDFPLDGSTGGDALPLGVGIISADIEVYVNNVELVQSVQYLLDLVPFPITGLRRDDFDSKPFATRAPPNLNPSEIPDFFRIDVTSLIAETQTQELSDLQLRFRPDFIEGAAGLVVLYDGDEQRDDYAPLLTVEYR